MEGKREGGLTSTKPYDRQVQNISEARREKHITDPST